MKKNRPISVRLTEEQRADLDLTASAAGQTPSAYLRELLAEDRTAREGRPRKSGRERAGVAELDEVLQILSSEARAGDISAARLLLRHLEREPQPSDAKSPVDAAHEVADAGAGTIASLAAKRLSRAAG